MVLDVLLREEGGGNAEVAAKLKRTEQDIANLKFQGEEAALDLTAAANLSPPCFRNSGPE